MNCKVLLRSLAIASASELCSCSIRRILNKPQGDILIDELSELQEVRLTEETDLTLKTLGDLEYMPNLKVLRLNEVKLQSADMSALGNLSKLEALHLTDCGVDNIDSLAELTEIRDLDLRGNHLTNLNFAASMPHLTYLNISGNAIEDLSPLRDCHELNELIANDVPVKDWSAVGFFPIIRPSAFKSRERNRRNQVEIRVLLTKPHNDFSGPNIDAIGHPGYESLIPHVDGL